MHDLHDLVKKGQSEAEENDQKFDIIMVKLRLMTQILAQHLQGEKSLYRFAESITIIFLSDALTHQQFSKVFKIILLCYFWEGRVSLVIQLV